MYLNLSGALRFFFCLALHHIDQTFRSAPNVRLFELCTSFLVLLIAEASGFLRVTYTQLFLLPSMITIVIAATRTYRALSIYATTPSNTGYEFLPTLFAHCPLTVLYPSGPSGPSGTDSTTVGKSNRLVSSSTKNSAAVVNIPSNRLEVTVHKAYDEYPMSPISRYPSSEAQADKPPHDLDLEVNAEGRDDSEELQEK